MSDAAERLEALFAIGAPPHADRPGFSAAEQAAHDLVAGWMRAAGLEVRVDAAGNLVGRRAGADPAAAPVWTGSHLDTVPSGGRFDGALGVVAALEAVARMPAPRRPVEVVAFRDEEGWRFGGGCFGSRALCGALLPGELDVPDRDGVTIRAALGALGMPAPPATGWLPAVRPAAFVELHVEQGSRLEAAGAPVGLAEQIVAMAGTSVSFHGRAAHAGTTPMTRRADALLAASAFALALPDLARDAVATVGALRLEPGASNVVPGRARCTLDVRGAATAEVLPAALEAARRAAAAHGCTVEADPPWELAPVRFDAALLDALDGGRGLPRLTSWAGHDAGILAGAGVPSAMLLVRSLAGGVSHSPDELTADDDVEAAIAVLADGLTSLAA